MVTTSIDELVAGHRGLGMLRFLVEGEHVMSLLTGKHLPRICQERTDG